MVDILLDLVEDYAEQMRQMDKTQLLRFVKNNGDRNDRNRKIYGTKFD